MVVNLQKGQRVDLTKGNASLNKIYVGLGWDPVQQKSGGLFSSLFGGGKAADVDCDASCLMLRDGKVSGKTDIVYFGNLRSANGAVAHSGDNLTGAGDGDDEVISVELKNIPAEYDKLTFVVNIYDARNRKQHFGMIQNAYIRIVNASTNEELIRYSLTDNYADMMSLVVGEIYRQGTDWKFAAVGSGTQDGSLGELIKKYQ